MSENRHTAQELRQWQALPLSIKVRMTQERVRMWVREFGESGVYVSFSGGKDSTVLLDIVRKMYPDVKAVFSNTGLEYPEIQRFVKQHENVDIVTPKIGFKDVVTQYGYPLIGKEVAEAIYYARRIRGGQTTGKKRTELYCTDNTQGGSTTNQGTEKDTRFKDLDTPIPGDSEEMRKHHRGSGDWADWRRGGL